MKGADTAGMKKFFSEVLCTDSEDILNDYFQNDVPIQSCGDLNIYEASQFKVFKRQLLIKNEDSVYKPLSTYLENWANLPSLGNSIMRMAPLLTSSRRVQNF